MIHIIINTCAGTTDETVLARRGSFDNSTKHPYAARAAKLQHTIDTYTKHLPNVNLIIVGEWHEGDGYTYIHDPGLTRSPVDQAQQRETATPDAHDNDILIYLNDDHFLSPEDLPLTVYEMTLNSYDIAAFHRKAIYHNDTNLLETGWPSYIHGHGHIITGKAAKTVRWGDVNTNYICCDVIYTQLARAANLREGILSQALYDIELGHHPSNYRNPNDTT